MLARQLASVEAQYGSLRKTKHVAFVFESCGKGAN